VRHYTGKHWPGHLLVAKVELGELEPVLVPLLGIDERKHVRLQEIGGRDGMPASRYAKALKEFKSLGVEYVSFYGVYVE
jgi:hypothetical protein